VLTTCSQSFYDIDFNILEELDWKYYILCPSLRSFINHLGRSITSNECSTHSSPGILSPAIKKSAEDIFSGSLIFDSTANKPLEIRGAINSFSKLPTFTFTFFCWRVTEYHHLKNLSKNSFRYPFFVFRGKGQAKPSLGYAGTEMCDFVGFLNILES